MFGFDPSLRLDIEALFLFLYRLSTGAGPEVSNETLRVLFYELWMRIAFWAALITPILLAALAYTIIRYHQMRAEELEAFVAKAETMGVVGERPRNERWERIMDLVSSDRPSDWRVAILEADVMMEEAITNMGYLGESFGEKLKSIDRGDLMSINAAWEAHKVRNQLAHGGGDYILTQREARRVIELYRQVFEELNYI